MDKRGDQPGAANEGEGADAGDGAGSIDKDRPLSSLLSAFEDHPPLRKRILAVLRSLPTEVQRDFVDDSRFLIAMDTVVPGQGRTFWLPAPGLNGSSRCVSLKPRLGSCSEEFAHYVIAHEFAHAYLRNGSWGEITDVEEAADALAASWGFARP